MSGRPQALEHGAKFEGFSVERLLGEGASAHVYLAHDETLGRPVALKVFKPEALSQGQAQFLAEARLTARLDHPNVVRVLQSGSAGETPFLVLEYVDGKSLAQLLREGALSSERVQQIALAVLDGLVCLHDQGLVHGDLKPDNVLVPGSGRVRLADFGLAAAVGQQGNGLGTGAWLSPQRWKGSHRLEAADDVWSFGVLLAEMLEGRTPYGPRAVCDAVFAGVALERPVLSGPLGAIAADCLSWDPARRPRSVEVLERVRRVWGESKPPFRGLFAFGEEEAEDFEGREGDADAALELMHRPVPLVVTGPSGVGKTSFVRARLLPRLRDRGALSVVSLRPGSSPLEALARALTNEGLAARLRDDPGRLKTALAGLRRAQRQPLLVIVDQLEEAFTLAPEAERARFFEALSKVSVPGEFQLLLLVRDDFLGRLFQTALGALSPAVLALRPLSLAELERAIRGPVMRCHGVFEPATLPTRIAQDVVSQPAPLPLLQFACRALWEQRDVERCVLRGADYERLGGAAGVLVTQAHEFMKQLDEAGRGRARALLLELVNPDGTRRPRDRSELPPGSPIDELVARRLVVLRSEADRSIVELAHESLTTVWPELRRWLEESTEAHRLQRDLENASERWERLGRRPEEIWRSDSIASVRNRLAGLSVSPRALRYLEASETELTRASRARRAVAAIAVAATFAFAVVATAVAIRFRENERRAVEQQEQLKVIAENLGDVELTLAPFDWDGRAVTPVAAHVGWRLWPVDPIDRERPLLERPLQLGGLVAATVGTETTYRFEAPGGDAFIEFFERGGRCASSWVRLRALPGYVERRRGVSLSARIPVPTCKASAADEIALGSDLWLDRTEAQNALFSHFETLLPRMGYARSLAPDSPSLRAATLPAGPVTGIDAMTASAFCRYLGKRLPTASEWKRAWAPATSGKANLEGDEDGWSGLTSADDPSLDVTPLGIIGLDGNVREWTSSISEIDKRQPLLMVLGGDFTLPAAMIDALRFTNRNHPESMDFALGVRCARGKPDW